MIGMKSALIIISAACSVLAAVPMAIADDVSRIAARLGERTSRDGTNGIVAGTFSRP